MRIAIIDNTISREFVKEITGAEVNSYQIIDGYCLPDYSTKNYLSHGSVCTALATEFIHDAEYFSVSVAPRALADFSISNLCIALDWCYKNQIEYICMSVGTENWLGAKPMISATKQLADIGSTVVCAVSPKLSLTFPACYPWTVAVCYDKGCNGIRRSDTMCSGYDVVVGPFYSFVLDQLSRCDLFFSNRTSSMAVPYFMGWYVQNNEVRCLPKEGPTIRKRGLKQMQCEIPIVRIIHSDVYQIKSLCRLLQQKDYMAALLSDRIETDWSQLFVHVRNAADIRCALNALQNAGIALLDIDLNQTYVRTFYDLEVDADYSFIDESKFYDLILREFS
ncbi:hypothetical protein I5Q82_16160 [Acutalibacter muris]|uniref:Peptidase S8/S53 domain-containing protein n=3 Tax=Acutalibacter muris TaxID=1796620 RepID=A0AA92L5U0_9FIRM|nr:hypothetical protein [Acutalibacter muris]QQR29550.1 hypothetical protein I5Q82_16160 [Acutalibacter muris]